MCICIFQAGKSETCRETVRLHTLEQELMLQPTGGISPSSGKLYFGS